jgi:DHA1 family multidrug resistance protein-like MFS transporter
VTAASAAADDWRRTLWLMLVMQSTMTTAFSIAGPFMPLYLIQLGVTPAAHAAVWAGAIASVQAFGVAVTSPLWGALADRTGRKAMVVRCCIATMLFYSLIALAQAPWQIFVIQMIAGGFGGFSGAAIALVGTQVPEGRLGYALGLMATGQLVGGLAGPLFGGVLADRFHDYRLVFACTAVGALLVMLLVTIFVRERFERPPATHERPSLREQTRELLQHPALPPLVIVLMLTQLTTFAAYPIIPLFVQGLVGNTPWVATAAGGAMAIVGVAGVIATPWLGRRGDRIGHRRVLAISLLGTGLFTLPQALAPNLWVFLALRFGVGVFLGGILPAANALIARTFPREHRGRIFGITSSATYLGLASGPTIGGLIGARFGFGTVFVVMGALVLATLAFVVLSARRPQESAA